MIDLEKADKLKEGDTLVDGRGKAYIITRIGHDASAPKGRRWTYSISAGEVHTYIHEMHFDRMSVSQAVETPTEAWPAKETAGRLAEKPVAPAKAKKRR